MSTLFVDPAKTVVWVIATDSPNGPAPLNAAI
jgi:hypothetical protein